MIFLSVNIVQCVWSFCIYAYLVFDQRRNVSTYHYESARVQLYESALQIRDNIHVFFFWGSQCIGTHCVS